MKNSPRIFDCSLISKQLLLAFIRDSRRNCFGFIHRSLVINRSDQQADTQPDNVHHCEALHRHRNVQFCDIRRSNREKPSKGIANAESCASRHNWEDVRGRHVAGTHRHADSKLGQKHKRSYCRITVGELFLKQE